jgi:hypothetical protein
MVYEETTPSGALNALFRRDWFKRIWILQEVALAKDILIQCGTQTASWAALATFLRKLSDKGILPPSWHPAWNLVTFRTQYQKPKTPGGIDVYTAMVQSRACEATDLRDKVYALLGVCRELAKLVGAPNYSLSVKEVWTTATMACLKSSLSVNSLSLVQSVEPGSGKPDFEDIPSWVAILHKSCRTWVRRPARPTPDDGQDIVAVLEDNCLYTAGAVLAEVVSKCDSTSNTDKNSVDAHLAIWKTWWNHYQQCLASSSGTHDIFTFWKTLYCDVDNSVNDEAELHIWHGKFLKGDLKALGREGLSNLRVSELVNCTSQRVFGMTTKGMGFFPKGVEIGDKIAVLTGATTPFLLRHSWGRLSNSETPVYQLIGPCYVHSLMSAKGNTLRRAKAGPILIA